VSNIVSTSDAYAVGFGNSVKLAEGFNVLAAIDHYWTPTFDTSLWGSYTRVNNPSGTIFTTGLVGGPVATVPDFYYWQVGAQANWVPAKGIKFAGTVNWFQVNRDRAIQDYVPTAGGLLFPVSKKDANGIQAALRIQRDF